MANQSLCAADYAATIKYVFDGVAVEPTRIFEEAKTGLHLASADDAATWAIAARKSLRRTPGVITIGLERGN